MNAEVDDSWNEGVVSKIYQLPSIGPSQLLNVLYLLKNLRVGSFKTKFSFGSESELHKFQKLMQAEEQMEEEATKRSSYVPIKEKYSSIDFISKKKHKLAMNSWVHAQIFLKHYAEKLEQFQNEHEVCFKQVGQDIVIASERSLGSILKTALIAMTSRIQVYIFYNDPEMYKILKSSELIRNKLAMVGIFCHLPTKKRCLNPAFYSTEINREGGRQFIRKQVVKEVSLRPKILDLYDRELHPQCNHTIFDLLLKNIKKSIDEISEVYEATLEVNQTQSCFVLHSQNEAFEEEPIALLSSKISNLFFFSFRLKNPRSYANQFKKQANKNKFIKVNNLKRKFYFCLDRLQIKDKKNILKIFKGFLEELEDRSELVLHLYYNHLLVKDSSLSQQILGLVHKNHLQVSNLQAIYDKTSYNMVIKAKNAVGIKENQAKLKRVQLNFSNFLSGLLMLEEKQKVITQEEIDWSIPSNNGEQTGNNRLRIIYKQKEQLNGSVQSEKSRLFLQSNASQEMTKSKTDSLFSNSKADTELMMKESSFLSAAYHVPKRASQQIGCMIQFIMEEPEESESDPHNQNQIQRAEKIDKKLRNCLYDQETLNFKPFKLKIKPEVFGYNQCKDKINRGKGYLVKNILQKGRPVEQVFFISFTSLQENQQAYLVYFDEEMNRFIPTHAITRKY